MTFNPVSSYRKTRQLYLDQVTLAHLAALLAHYGVKLMIVVRSRAEAAGPTGSNDPVQDIVPLGHYTVRLGVGAKARDVRVLVTAEGRVRELETQGVS